jgi:hypothetical protein
LFATTSADEPWKPGIPTNWNIAPSTIQSFPYDADTRTYYVDVWNYTQRLGAYKPLLNDSKSLHFDPAGFDSPLWGLPLQFGWQHDTGRLLGGTGDVVSISSWWGGMNFMLSAIPFVGALEAGVIQNIPAGCSVKLRPPRPAGNITFCTTYEECLAFAPNATQNWKNFFVAVKEQEHLTLNESVVLLWRAHVQSLHEGLPRMESLLQHLPSKEEASFGLSWANLVDFIAALRFDVDYNRTNFLQGMIVPPRTLTSNDRAPVIKDFTPAQNRALVVASLFNAANEKLNGGLLKLFKKACCTEKGRDDAYFSMIDLLEGKALLTIENIIKFVVDLVKSHPC